MNRFAVALTRVIIVVVFCLSHPFAALGDELKEDGLHIEPQPLSAALREFSEQTGLQVGYASEIVEGKSTEGVEGIDDPDLALESLLASSGLTYTFVNAQTVVVQTGAAETPEEERGDSELGNGRTAGASPVPTAQVQTSTEQDPRSRRTETDIDEGEENRPIEEIIVTGTNIRGIAPESSPMRVFDHDDILNSGAATAQDFIRTLPQNFGGGASGYANLTPPGNEQAGRNVSQGSSVNLRGLGSGATLVLLNGRRIAPSSDIGGFVDISMIPASAIERVEVLTDGASSIYGADAVGGVINFILRDDYEGVETSVRYGTVTEGDREEYRVGLTGGTSWGSGNGLLGYEYYRTSNLDAGDRDHTGGILSPNDLLPKQEHQAVLGSLSQELTPDLSFGGDILFSQRDSIYTWTSLSGVAVGRTLRAGGSTDNLNIGANLNWNMAQHWYFDLSGNYSTIDIVSHNTVVEFQENLEPYDIQSDHWSLDAIASGTVFELPAGSAKLAIGGHYREEALVGLYRDEVQRDGDRKVSAVFGEVFLPIIGPENALPGIRRLELNVSGRYEDYSDFGSSANPKAGVLWAPTDDLRLRGSYSTSFKPPTVGQTGAQDRGTNSLPTSLVLSIFGVEAADSSLADTVLLQVFGTADGLGAETSRSLTGGFDYDAESGRHSISLSSTYFDIVFEGRIGRTPMPGAQNRLLAFNIAFDSPELFPEGSVVYNPSPDELNAIILANSSRGHTAPFDTDPRDATVISFLNLTRNLAITEVRGVDFDATYSFDGGLGRIVFGVAGTYLIDFTQQAAVSAATVQLLDTRYNPLDLRLRGRAGYAGDRFNANLFVNYDDDYRVDGTDTAAPIESWITVDLSLSFETGERYQSASLDNMEFGLFIRNLFNEEPPSAPSNPSLRILGFDPTNASPLGRFVAVELTKRF